MNTYVNQYEINNSLSDYYSELNFTKVEDKIPEEGPSAGFSIYAAKIHTMLTHYQRYIIVFATRDSHPVGTSTRLKNLNWSCLQTRELSQSYSLPAQSHTATRSLNYNLNAKERNIDKSIYECDILPITVQILNDPKYKSKFQHPQTLKLYQALELYKTILIKI